MVKFCLKQINSQWWIDLLGAKFSPIFNFLCKFFWSKPTFLTNGLNSKKNEKHNCGLRGLMRHSEALIEQLWKNIFHRKFWYHHNTSGFISSSVYHRQRIYWLQILRTMHKNPRWHLTHTQIASLKYILTPKTTDNATKFHLKLDIVVRN